MSKDWTAFMELIEEPIGMDKQSFRYHLAMAGYSNEQIAFAESVLRRMTVIPVSNDEVRRAAYKYMLVCTDIDKLQGFLLLTDHLTRRFSLAWEEAVEANLAVIVGWCH